MQKSNTNEVDMIAIKIEIKNLKEEIMNMKSEIHLYKERNDELTKRIDMLVEENHNLKRSISVIEDKNKDLSKEFEELKNSKYKDNVGEKGKGENLGDHDGGTSTSQDDFDDHIPIADRLKIFVSPNVDDGIKSPSSMVKNLKLKARQQTYKAKQNPEPKSGLQKV